MKDGYTVIDVLKYSFSIMDNIEVSLGDTDYTNKWLESIGGLYGIDNFEGKIKKSLEIDKISREKRNDLSNEDYLRFLKECDIYIYITLYNTSNTYEFPIKKPTDNYYWVIGFHEFRENTKEQLDFAIEKITACLEWTKKKNNETKGGMREWVEKNQVYLNKLIEKREKYGVLDSLSK